MLTEPAGYSNPCTPDGLACSCDSCDLAARHLRELPKRARDAQSEREGTVYIMTMRGPKFPRALRDVELCCEHHVKDWIYGLQPFGAPDAA